MRAAAAWKLDPQYLRMRATVTDASAAKGIVTKKKAKVTPAKTANPCTGGALPIATGSGIALAPGWARDTNEKLAKQVDIMKQRRKAREEATFAKKPPPKGPAAN